MDNCSEVVSMRADVSTDLAVTNSREVVCDNSEGTGVTSGGNEPEGVLTLSTGDVDSAGVSEGVGSSDVALGGDGVKTSDTTATVDGKDENEVLL